MPPQYDTEIDRVLAALLAIAEALKEQTAMMREAKAADRSAEQIERLLAHADANNKRINEHVEKCERRYLERVRETGSVS